MKIKRKISIIILHSLIIYSCKNNPVVPKIYGSIPLPDSAIQKGKFIISDTSSHSTTEAGGSVKISLSLDKEPSADVILKNISVSDSLEGLLDKSTLTFTNINWNTSQVITVTGVDDLVVDGNKKYFLRFESSSSNDLAFNNILIDPIEILNTDNDVIGFAITPKTGLSTNETGTTATFTIQLTSEPISSVTIPTISSSNILEGIVSPTTITFTTTNWNIPQTITATGIDDALGDGNQVYLIQFSAAVSSDSVYSGKVADPVSITNVDNESFGITVGAISGNTTEAGGTATFSVVLSSATAFNVVIPIASSNTAEGTVSTTSLTFTSANWNTPQIVTVTGVNDFVQDGTVAYTINLGPTTSSNSNYNGLTPTAVNVSNTDNDVAGYNITNSSSILMVSDGGQLSPTITMSLRSQPTANVTIPVSSTVPTEVSLSASSLVFTPANWNINQVLTLTGVSDGVADGNQTFTIVLGLPTTTDTVYAALNPTDQTGGSCDNDTGGTKIVACRATNSPTTTENGGSAQYYIILSQSPTANVSVSVTSADTTQGTVSPASLTLDTTNWNQFAASNLITVTGANDANYDGDVFFNINFGAAVSTDAFFSGFTATPISIINIDNEVYFTVSAVTGSPINETGTTATYTITLPSPPTATVSFTLSSSDTTEGTVSPTNVSFGTGVTGPQLITITGIDDNIADGNRTFNITSTAAVSTDLRFNGKTPASRSVTNNDESEKRTYITATQYTGNLGNITGADTICGSDANKPSITPNTYKALLVNGTSRVATTSAGTNTGQTGWVFAANTKYFRSDGSTQIFTSDGNGLFSFGTLTNSFGTAGNDFWTGLNSDWTTATNHCSSWSTTATNGEQGSATSTGTNSLTTGTIACTTNTLRIICVQQ